MSDLKLPPDPVRWGDKGALPCVLNSALCFWIGTVHFVVSGGHADFVLVALIVICFLPWLGHVFQSIGKDGATYRDGGQSGSTEKPPPETGFDATSSEKPTKTADESALSDKPAFFNLCWEARKVLATLWKYQQIHFPPPKQGLWTFIISPSIPEYVIYTRGLMELAKYNLAGIAENGQAALTLEGIAYCKKHSDVISTWLFTYDNFSN